jgi:DNA-binding transcriptional MerR regulator
MRMAELSRRTGVPVPTIKYYLREGLLPAGERISRNQASYDEAHVRRLQLVRALVDVGGLSCAATRDVLSRIDAPDMTVHNILGKAHYALTVARDHVEDGAWERASQEVADLISRCGWRVGPDNPARQTLTEVLATLHRLGQEDIVGLLDDYAEAVERLATAELAMIARRTDLDSMVQGAVIGTVLGDILLAAMRRLAQENESASVLQRAAPRDHAGAAPHLD